MTDTNTATVANKIAFKKMAGYIARFGKEQTLLVQGPPGIGKSALLTQMKPMFPEHKISYIDCANLSLGDLAMPVIDTKGMVTRYAPNEAFHASPDYPTIIMLDEIGKAGPEVINMLMPLMLEKRLGSVQLHPDSIIYATSNMESDRLGDKFPAHALNRVTRVTMSPPSADDWITWASSENKSAALLAFVKTHPQVLQPYDELTGEENPYIYNPKSGNIRSFVSPRSLARLSPFCDAYAKGELPQDDFQCFATGTIGEAGAAALITLAALAVHLPDLKTIVEQPAKALEMVTSLDGSGLSASHLLVMTLLSAIKTEVEFNATADFLQKLPMEPRLLFQTLMLKKPQFANFHRVSKASKAASEEISLLLS